MSCPTFHRAQDSTLLHCRIVAGRQTDTKLKGWNRTVSSEHLLGLWGTYNVLDRRHRLKSIASVGVAFKTQVEENASSQYSQDVAHHSDISSRLLRKLMTSEALCIAVFHIQMILIALGFKVQRPGNSLGGHLPVGRPCQELHHETPKALSPEKPARGLLMPRKY
eukprot:185552-Amphidinium_carterae.1